MQTETQARPEEEITEEIVEEPDPVQQDVSENEEEIESMLDAAEEEGEEGLVCHEIFQTLMQLLRNKEEVFLVGPAGSGKTHAAMVAAKLLGVPFYCQSVGGQTSMSHLMGYMDATGTYRPTAFRKAFEGGGLFLMDEIDAGNANVLTCLNAAIGNRVCSFPDKMVECSEDFFFMGAGNTYGTGANRQYVGRNPLDGATLDRPAVLDWPYDEELELTLAGLDCETWVQRVQSIRAACLALDIRLIVSPRASIRGAKLLRDGMDQSLVEEVRIWKGVSKETRSKIEAKIKETPKRKKRGGSAALEVGQKVSILQIVAEVAGDKSKQTEAERRMTTTGFNNFTPEKRALVGTVGTVTNIEKDGEEIRVEFKVGDGNTTDWWSYSPRMLDNGSGKNAIKPGSKVKVLPSVRQGKGKGPGVTADMISKVGKIITVKEMGRGKKAEDEGRFRADSNWWIPEWVEVQSQDQGRGEGQGQPGKPDTDKRGKPTQANDSAKDGGDDSVSGEYHLGDSSGSLDALRRN